MRFFMWDNLNVVYTEKNHIEKNIWKSQTDDY